MSLRISPAETKKLLDSGFPLRLIDVREPDELAICKIAGAESIPLGTLGEVFRARLPDPGERIIIYCHHGMRSLRAAEFLSQHGYTNVGSMDGGIEAWSQQVDPSVPRY